MVNLAAEAWFNTPELKTVMELLNADGGETRIVGGAVRNSLMGLPIADVDLATDLLPEDVMARAQAADIKVIPTGIDHGTVTLVVNKRPFEVTTLRRDIATNGRHAEVAFGKDWQEDANRRDLTMNALYADRDGNVIDLVNGIVDAESRTARFIGDANARIEEDYLRILRYFRFFAHYGSGRPDADALRAIARGKGGISQLSAERIWAEMKKLLSAGDPGRALLWMRTTGVLALVFPETEKWGIDEIPGLVAAEKALGWEVNPLLRLAAMVPPDEARLEAMCARLKMSKAEDAFFASFAKAHVPDENLAATAFARLLYAQGADGFVTRLKIAVSIARVKAENDMEKLPHVAALLKLLKQAETWERPVFPVKGADILASGVPAGPDVGRILSGLESQWVDSNFTLTREALLENTPN